MNDIIVIGAGLSGVTVARLLAENGYNVSIYDKRKTVGGNVYDKYDKNGILVQEYGPHIFHTNIQEVFDFLSKYTEWTKYEHRVLASIDKKLVPVPFNLTSLFSLYDEKSANRIKEKLIDTIGLEKKVPILELKKSEDKEISTFADFVYKNIFYTYTKKQWGFAPEELGEAVMNRVPVYISNEDRYFTDEFQFMPKDGFTQMVNNILSHPNIKLYLGENSKDFLFLDNGKIYVKGKEFNGKVIYCGCIDELFNNKFGVLPYRSLRFKFKKVKTISYQPTAVVNYTTSKKYTRITEFTKFTCSPKINTVICKEYPKPYKNKKDIPYYPIPIEENITKYNKYLNEAKAYENLELLGRLANYKYINMDVAIKNAIDLANKILGE